MPVFYILPGCTIFGLEPRLRENDAELKYPAPGQEGAIFILVQSGRLSHWKKRWYFYDAKGGGLHKECKNEKTTRLMTETALVSYIISLLHSK